jgi:hypothetical protein
MDASGPCIILFHTKNSPDLLPDGRLLGQSLLVLEWTQPATVVGLVPQLGAGALEGQYPQVVRVKGSDSGWGSCG